MDIILAYEWLMSLHIICHMHLLNRDVMSFLVAVLEYPLNRCQCSLWAMDPSPIAATGIYLIDPILVYGWKMPLLGIRQFLSLVYALETFSGRCTKRGENVMWIHPKFHLVHGGALTGNRHSCNYSVLCGNTVVQSLDSLLQSASRHLHAHTPVLL